MTHQGSSDGKHVVQRIENKSLQVYDPRSAPQDSDYVVTDRSPSGNNNALLALGVWARSLQDLMQQQMALFREFESRLSRVEQANRQTPGRSTFEERTWWALWSITMLLLGAALTVVIFVILTTVLH